MEKWVQERERKLNSIQQQAKIAVFDHLRTLRCATRASMPDVVKFGQTPKKAVLSSESEPRPKLKPQAGASKPCSGFEIRFG